MTTPNSGTIDWTLPYSSPCSGFDCTTELSGGDGVNYIKVSFGSNTQSGYLQVRKNNLCGIGGAKVMWLTISGGGVCTSCPLAVVSPNPVSDELVITFTDSEGNMLTNSAFTSEKEYILWDPEKGTKILSHRSGNTKQIINVRDIQRKGVYILEIIHSEGERDQHRILIE